MIGTQIKQQIGGDERRVKRCGAGGLRSWGAGFLEAERCAVLLLIFLLG